MDIMKNTTPNITRTNIKIIRDTSRVVARPLLFEDTQRIPRLIKKILNLSDIQAAELLKKVKRDFSHRHSDLESILLRHFEIVAGYVPPDAILNDSKKKLIGSYFTMEYSIESAALFNPSIVPHPDQSNLPAGSLRFIMSLRATGEGHISSIVFRTGVVDKNNTIALDGINRYAVMPEVHQEQNSGNTNYSVQFHSGQKLSERVIFPVLKNESKGIEDARFVKFTEDNGENIYFATYTAFDGFSILPKVIETKDFLSFNVITLQGNAVQNKGMALFPRKINGKYVMLSRQDGETNKIMFSDNLHKWEKADHLQDPAEPWEFVQIGNCGSPIETEKGWLVLTHGVGPMRKYSIGAILLDLKHPEKIIARLEHPLLSPNEEEREGYVPNVVYSCGSLIHNGTLILPYAMSDISSGIATVGVNELIDSMKHGKE
jgi:predicted GH43/DUF377 family glycosyl hydrolase